MRRLTVGLLHGLYQNKAVFAQKTQPLRALLPSAAGVDLDYLDGPHPVVPPVLRAGAKRKGLRAPRRRSSTATQRATEASANTDGASATTATTTTTTAADSTLETMRALHEAGADAVDYRGWWDPSDAGTAVEAETLETLRGVGAQLRRDRVDGLIGFSQGGALAALLCTNKARELLDWSPAFVVLCCAYESKLPFHQEFLRSGVDPTIPSLHIAGGNDKVVVPEKSWELSRVFHDAERAEMRAGHMFPTDDATLADIADFVDQARLRLSISCP